MDSRTFLQMDSMDEAKQRSVRRAASDLVRPSSLRKSMEADVFRRSQSMPDRSSRQMVQQLSTPEALEIVKRYVHHAAFMASDQDGLAQKLLLACLGLFHHETYARQGDTWSDAWLRDLLGAADSSGACANRLAALKLELSSLFERSDPMYPQVTVLKAIDRICQTIFTVRGQDRPSPTAAEVKELGDVIDAWEAAFVLGTRRKTDHGGSSSQNSLTEADGLNDSNVFALLNIGEKMSVIVACAITMDWSVTMTNTAGVAIFRSLDPVAGSVAAAIVIFGGLVQMLLRIPSGVLIRALFHPGSVQDPSLQLWELYRIGTCTFLSFFAGVLEVLNGLEVLFLLGFHTPELFGPITAWLYAMLMVAVETSNAAHARVQYVQARYRVNLIKRFEVKDHALPLLHHAKAAFLLWAKQEANYVRTEAIVARDFCISMAAVLLGLLLAVCFVGEVNEAGRYNLGPSITIWLCFALYWTAGMAAHFRGYLHQRNRKKQACLQQPSTDSPSSVPSNGPDSTTSSGVVDSDTQEQDIQQPNSIVVQ